MSKFYTRYSKPPQISSNNDMPSLTNQQFKNETDINYIISHCTQESFQERLRVGNSALKFGEMLGSVQKLDYFTDLKDQENEFNLLPPSIRKEYNMSFKNFLESVTSSKAGIEKACKLGILPKSFIIADDVVVSPSDSVSGKDFDTGNVGDLAPEVVKKEN